MIGQKNGVRLTNVVVGCNPEIHARLDFRSEQMWAVGPIGDQSAAVERGAREAGDLAMTLRQVNS
jgi:hypothetical protein